MIRFVSIITLGAVLTLKTGCVHRALQGQGSENGPAVAGSRGDTVAVLKAIVALSGGPDSVVAARSKAEHEALEKELCGVFDQDCSLPEPTTTWYATPTPTVRKLAALRGVPLVESATPPLPACPMRPRRSERNTLADQPVGYQVRAGIRFESPEVAVVATEAVCDAPAWWPEGDVIVNGDSYRVQYRSGKWRARWASHVF